MARRKGPSRKNDVRVVRIGRSVKVGEPHGGPPKGGPKKPSVGVARSWGRTGKMKGVGNARASAVTGKPIKFKPAPPAPPVGPSVVSVPKSTLGQPTQGVPPARPPIVHFPIPSREGGPTRTPVRKVPRAIRY